MKSAINSCSDIALVNEKSMHRIKRTALQYFVNSLDEVDDVVGAVDKETRRNAVPRLGFSVDLMKNKNRALKLGDGFRVSSKILRGNRRPPWRTGRVAATRTDPRPGRLTLSLRQHPKEC